MNKKMILPLASLILLIMAILLTIYFKNLENKATNSYCIQVIAPAISPEGKCKNFSTPCDIPDGWEKTDICETAENETEK